MAKGGMEEQGGVTFLEVENSTKMTFHKATQPVCFFLTSFFFRLSFVCYCRVKVAPSLAGLYLSKFRSRPQAPRIVFAFSRPHARGHFKCQKLVKKKLLVIIGINDIYILIEVYAEKDIGLWNFNQ